MSDELAVNMAALLNLRGLPRGVDVDSRIKAINNLLTEKEVWESFRFLRHKINCPECGSENIVTTEPPEKNKDKNKCFYECEDCGHIFDDLAGTGFEGITYTEMRNFIMSWYLMAFCPMKVIAEFCGLSFAEVAEYMHLAKEMEKEIGELKKALDKHFEKKNTLGKKNKEKDYLDFRKRQLKRLMYGLKPKNK